VRTSPSASVSERRRFWQGDFMGGSWARSLIAIGIWSFASLGAQPAALAQGKFEKSKEEEDLEVHEKKSRTGVKIAPPSGAASPRSDGKAVDDLFRSLPEDARDDGEVSLPAEGLGMELVNPEEIERRRLENRRRELLLKAVDDEQSGGRKALDERHTRELSDIERRLGVESNDPGLEKPPSYTLSVQKIKDLYRARDYEEALILLTDTLRHYPRAPQLLMMKGTLHQKLGQIDLAAQAYQRAFEYEPSRRLKAQIDYIRRLQAERERLRPRREGIVIPLGVEEATFITKPKASPKTLNELPKKDVPSLPSVPDVQGGK
jgi:tetratricopeptide (TPR) repeat protein